MVIHLKPAQPPSLLPLFSPSSLNLQKISLLQKTKPKGTKKVKSKKPKGRSDEDVFGNTDDTFGDLPAAAKTKTKKDGMK